MSPLDARSAGMIGKTLAGTLRLLRRVILALAALSCFSVTLGFMALAMGLGEGAFLLFVTCASSLAGLALTAFCRVLAAKREAGDE